MPFLPVSLGTCSGSLQPPCEKSSYPEATIWGEHVEMRERVREGGWEGGREGGGGGGEDRET